jgi:hypothetical protein
MATRKTASKPAATTATKPAAKAESKSTTTARKSTAPAAAKAPPAPRPKTEAPTAKAEPKAVESKSAAAPTGEARYRWIAHAAYLRAEKRGFAPGHEFDDWLAAEGEFLEAHKLP